VGEPHKVREGHTDELEWVLSVDGGPFALTGMTVELILRDNEGDDLAYAGTFEKDADQVTNPGLVRYAPHEDDLISDQSPYEVVVRVTDTDGRVAFFPEGSGITELLLVTR